MRSHDVRRLRAVERDLETLKREHAAERHLWAYRLEASELRLAVSQVEVEVWGGAFNEAASGQVLPLAAIMARLEVTLRARNIDRPLPPYRPLLPDGTRGA